MTIVAEPSQAILANLSLDDMLSMYQLSQAIFALHDLRLPDYLERQGAQTLTALAQALKVDPKALGILLDWAITLNLIQQNEQNCYYLTPLGQRLCDTSPDSVIPVLNHHREGYGAWSALLHTLQTGKPAFDQVYHTDIYHYQGQHPETLHYFNRYMQQTTTAWLTEVAEQYDFSGHIVDVGGNRGALMARLLQRFPKLQGTIFDLEQSVAQAPAVLVEAGVKERCQVVSGNFFEPKTLPKDGTLYLISRVLLNWDDQDAVQILKNCRWAMPVTSKLLILDFVLSDENAVSTIPLLHSLHLGVMFGARTRKRAEFEQLVHDAGFTALHWISINKTTFLLEASPLPSSSETTAPSFKPSS